MAQIQIRSLSKRFGAVSVIDNLDLEVRDREFMVLLGPSGCGKTTTLNIIAGLEDLSGGELLFDGRRVNDIPPHRRDIAMVFQSYALYPQKTVFENIAFGLRLRRMPDAEIRRRVVEVAESLEIGHLLSRRPAQLSGGQRQRVALGRAIVRKPSAFLMDEPLSNLDAALRVNMRTLIKQIHLDLQTTFIHVTHDQAEAMTLADRITVMRGGKVQQIGRPQEIYETPANVFVAQFLGSPQINLVGGRLEAHEQGLALKDRSGQKVGTGTELGPHLAPFAGREVLVGMRPEDLGLDPKPQSLSLPGRVSLVSTLGSEQLVTVGTSAGDLLIRVGKDRRLAMGDTVEVHIDRDRLHWFDQETGERLPQG
jgi:multiple sugar transport system ATP-binding protein